MCQGTGRNNPTINNIKREKRLLAVLNRFIFVLGQCLGEVCGLVAGGWLRCLFRAERRAPRMDIIKTSDGSFFFGRRESVWGTALGGP